MCVVKMQYLEMFIKCLTRMPLSQQGSLHLGNKAAVKKTVKIGSELFAYSFYHRSQTYCVWTILGLSIDLKMWLQQDQKLVSLCPFGSVSKKREQVR